MINALLLAAALSLLTICARLIALAVIVNLLKSEMLWKAAGRWRGDRLDIGF